MNVTLPLKALSLNNCYRGQRFATREKKQYDRVLQLLLPKVRVEGPLYVVTFRFRLKSVFMCDLDNLSKVLLDNIVSRGIISNDRKVVELHLFKERAASDSIEVSVESLA